MSRKKTPEPTVDQVEDDSLGEGHNSEARAQAIHRFAHEIVAAKEAVKVMAGKVKAIRKEAQLFGIPLKELDINIGLLEMTPDEQRVFFTNLHEAADALHIAHVPVGAQLDLLDHTPDPEVRSRDWHAKGFAAATTGKGVPGVPPDECPPEHVNDWLGGWNDGQVKNAPKELVTEPEPA